VVNIVRRAVVSNQHIQCQARAHSGRREVGLVERERIIGCTDETVGWLVGCYPVQTGLSKNESSRAGVWRKREGSEGENQGIGGAYDPPGTIKTRKTLSAGPLNHDFDSDSTRN
jgi:hypothetical protein